MAQFSTQRPYSPTERTIARRFSFFLLFFFFSVPVTDFLGENEEDNPGGFAQHENDIITVQRFRRVGIYERGARITVGVRIPSGYRENYKRARGYRRCYARRTGPPAAAATATAANRLRGGGGGRPGR